MSFLSSPGKVDPSQKGADLRFGVKYKTLFFLTIRHYTNVFVTRQYGEQKNVIIKNITNSTTKECNMIIWSSCSFNYSQMNVFCRILEILS